MARQTQKVPSDEKRLREALRKYLLVVDESPHGNDLVDAVVRVFKTTHLGRVVRLQGDKYFGGLIADLLSKWGTKVSMEDESNPSHHVLHVPGPVERIEDLPAVIAQMVGELTRSFEKRSLKIPTWICGNSIKFLLGFPHWQDFGNIRKFIELMLAEEWVSDKGTIELRKALVLFRDNLKQHTPPVYNEPRTPKMQEWLGDPPPERDQIVSDLRHYHWFENMLNPSEDDFEYDLVSSYLFANSSEPHSIAHRFRLDSVGQVMHNVHALWRRLPGRPLLDESSDKTVVQVIRIRAQQFRNSLKANTKKSGKELDDQMWENLQALHPDNVWHGWNENAEIEELVKLGRCTSENYHDLMSKCHFGLSYREPDKTYDEWKAARDSLFGYGKKKGRSRKPVVIARTLYNQLEINGKSKNYTGRTVKAVAFMIKSQKECLKSGKEPMFDRVILCGELKIPEGPSRFTALRDILKGTPLEGKCCSLRRHKKQKTGLTNKYLLDVDIENSRVDE